MATAPRPQSAIVTNGDVVPVVTTSTSPNICPGSSVTLSAPQNQTSYLWSTGATTAGNQRQSTGRLHRSSDFAFRMHEDLGTGPRPPCRTSPLPNVTVSAPFLRHDAILHHHGHERLGLPILPDLQQCRVPCPQRAMSRPLGQADRSLSDLDRSPRLYGPAAARS